MSSDLEINPEMRGCFAYYAPQLGGVRDKITLVKGGVDKFGMKISSVSGYSIEQVAHVRHIV